MLPGKRCKYLSMVVAAAILSSAVLPAGIFAAEPESPLYLEGDDYTANGEYAFGFDELELDAENTAETNGGTDVFIGEDGSATFTFKGQYAQAFFKLPEGIDPLRVTRVEFMDADPTNFSVKVQPVPGDDSLTSGVTYGNNALNISGLEFGYFACMTTGEGGTYTASKVVLSLGDVPVVEDDTQVEARTLADLMIAESSGATVEDGTVTFTAQYQSIFFALPEDIEAGRLAGIEVREDANVYNYKVMTQEQYEDPSAKYGDGIVTQYGNPLLDFHNADARYLVIMSGDVEPYGTFSLNSEILFHLEASREVQMDIPNLKDVVASDETGIGADGFMGTCLGAGSLQDEKLVTLVKKHFNAITLENELKPDSLLTGTNAQLVEDEEFGLVPSALDFSRPEQILDKVLEWNQEEGVNIKVRGHVLTWHQQTPTWFFREGYQSDGAYVTAEEMARRQEWYIKGIMEHFFSEDSKYKDLFYGFDVVNEAVSDTTGTYRSESENSEWALIYGTGSEEDAPEYILNAFRFANKYAPASLELYYNDYNECASAKVPAIAKLLTSVKKHESDEVNPTRIDAFGMQGHHGADSPSKEQIVECALTYGTIVGKVQITELDVKTSGTSATRDAEYTRMGYRYKDIIDAYREVEQESDIDVNSFTVWGAIDSVSWLNDANNAGGGSDGTQRQYPLLFDGNYQAKPAFWAIVDEEMLDPFIKTVQIMQKSSGEDPYAFCQSYSFDQLEAFFVPAWDEDGVSFHLQVGTDVAVDQVALYANWEGDDSQAVEPIRMEGNETGEYVLEAARENPAGATLSFDLVITLADEEGTIVPYNNRKLTHDTDSRFFAQGMIKPFMEISKGRVEVDGDVETAWDAAADIPLLVTGGAPEAKALARVLWDESFLYVLMDVADPELDAASVEVHEKDSIEVFIDENNEKATSYQEDDKQYRINYLGEASFNGAKCTPENLRYVVKETEQGYLVEAAFAWTDITPEADRTIGLDLQINDGKEGARIGTVNWFDASGNGWSSPDVFGEAILQDDSTLSVE